MSSTHDVTKEDSCKVTAPPHCRDRDWFIMALTHVLCAVSCDTGGNVAGTEGAGVTTVKKSIVIVVTS